MDIGLAFVDTWNIYRKNFIVIILAELVFFIMSVVTLGILSYPMMVGFQTLFVKAKRGENIKLTDIFIPVRQSFFRLIGLIIWISIIMLLLLLPAIISFILGLGIIGAVLLLIAVLVNIHLVICWMFSYLLVSDKGLGINEALKASREMVRKNNFWLHLLLLILGGIVANLGCVLWGIGFLLTMPFGVGSVACAYVQENN